MIDTSLDTSNFYFLIAVIQGFVLSLLIFFRQPPRVLHRLLGILIFLFSLSLLHLILEESIHAFNGRFPIPMDFGMAYGPLAYFHVLLIKNPKRKFLKKRKAFSFRESTWRKLGLAGLPLSFRITTYGQPRRTDFCESMISCIFFIRLKSA